MKATTLEVIITLAGVRGFYNSLVTEEHIRDAAASCSWFNENREDIINDFLMLAVYDSYLQIASNVTGVVNDAKTSNN